MEGLVEKDLSVEDPWLEELKVEFCGNAIVLYYKHAKTQGFCVLVICH